MGQKPMSNLSRTEEIKRMTAEFPLPVSRLPTDVYEECKQHGSVFHAIYQECPVCRAEDIRKRDAARVSIQARLYGVSEPTVNLPVFRPSAGPTAGEVFAEDANADYREEVSAPPGLGWWFLLGGAFWMAVIAFGAVVWLWKISYR
jgi:hypothetical protein